MIDWYGIGIGKGWLNTENQSNITSSYSWPEFAFSLSFSCSRIFRRIVKKEMYFTVYMATEMTIQTIQNTYSNYFFTLEVVI